MPRTERAQPCAEPDTPWTSLPWTAVLGQLREVPEAPGGRLSHLSPGTAVRLVTHTTSLSPATTSCRQVRLIDLLKLPPLAPVSAASAPTAGSRPSSLRCTEGPPTWTPLLHLLPVAFPGSPAAPAASLQAAATPSRFPFHPSLGVSLTLRPLACGSLCLGHAFSSGLLGQLLNSSAGGTRPQQLPLLLVSSVRLHAAHRAGEG